MPSIASEYACPTCLKSGARSQIIASDGRLICSVNSGHVWNDTMEFLNQRPTKEFAVAAPAPAPQQGHTKLHLDLSVPIGHAESIRAKLGPKLEVTIAGWVSMLAEGEVMLITAADLQRLKQLAIIGKTPQSSSELVGMVYAADMQATEAKDNERRALEEVSAWEGRNRHLLIIDLAEHRQYADTKAKDEAMPTKVWVEEKMKNGIANNWF